MSMLQRWRSSSKITKDDPMEEDVPANGSWDEEDAHGEAAEVEEEAAKEPPAMTYEDWEYELGGYDSEAECLGHATSSDYYRAYKRIAEIKMLRAAERGECLDRASASEESASSEQSYMCNGDYEDGASGEKHPEDQIHDWWNSFAEEAGQPSAEGDGEAPTWSFDHAEQNQFYDPEDEEWFDHCYEVEAKDHDLFNDEAMDCEDHVEVHSWPGHKDGHDGEAPSCKAIPEWDESYGYGLADQEVLSWWIDNVEHYDHIAQDSKAVEETDRVDEALHGEENHPSEDSTHLDLISISSKEDAFTEMEVEALIAEYMDMPGTEVLDPPPSSKAKTDDISKVPKGWWDDVGVAPSSSSFQGFTFEVDETPDKLPQPMKKRQQLAAKRLELQLQSQQVPKVPDQDAEASTVVKPTLKSKIKPAKGKKVEKPKGEKPTRKAADGPMTTAMKAFMESTKKNNTDIKHSDAVKLWMQSKDAAASLKPSLQMRGRGADLKSRFMRGNCDLKR